MKAAAESRDEVVDLVTHLIIQILRGIDPGMMPCYLCADATSTRYRWEIADDPDARVTRPLCDDCVATVRELASVPEFKQVELGDE